MNLLTAKEVAQQLKINKMTVYDLLRQKEIPAAMIRGQYRIREQDLEMYVDRLINESKEA